PATPVPVPMQQLTPLAPLPPQGPAPAPISSAPAPAPAAELARAQVPAPQYYVNVGIFGQDAQSKSTMAKLRDSALPLSLQAVDTNRGKATRVRVGPFATEDSAQAAAATVRSQTAVNATVAAQAL
ncbi:MAG: SPOR domain-containing protein, partial [Comamonadaceae bacterium]